MYKLLGLLCLSLVIIYVTGESIEPYKGYKLFSIDTKNDKERIFLNGLEKSGMNGIDFWGSRRTSSATSTVDIMVTPDTIEEFQNILNSQNFDYKIVIDDMAAIIKKEKENNLYQQIKPRLGNNDNHPNFDYFWRYSEVNAYLDKLSQEYPDLVQVVNIGKSFEGRDIKAIEISRNAKITGDRPIIFVDATIHAREWIAPMVALELIHQLVENNEQHNDLLESVDWMIVPIINVDGYEFSHTDERLWRKTRSMNENTDCIGTDPNRNFDFKWGFSGTSSDPCSEIYPGSSPHSEIEVQNLVAYLNKYKSLSTYVTLHSYGEYLLYPYGYDGSDVENVEEHEEVGSRVRSKIYDVYGTFYVLGNSARLLYEAAGTSSDYAKAISGANISFTVELPGGGYDGFDIPATEIPKVLNETIPGIFEFGKYVVEKYSKL